jgi:predicted AAA+ superfamily ATPase
MFKRQVPLPRPGSETFFLWGARQTGKTTLLHVAYLKREFDYFKATDAIAAAACMNFAQSI